MPCPPELERLRGLLCGLQDHLRSRVLGARDSAAAGAMATVAAVTASDTIYAVDKVSEETISEWFAANWPHDLPVELVMEGAEEHGPLTFPTGTPVRATAWKCILDPIDGTRNIMYDKRSAWALAGIAPQKGPATTLQDIVVAAMTELPTTRQWRSDQLSAVRGWGFVATGQDLRGGGTAPLHFKPSQAYDCRHGFASVTRFFPDGLGLLGQLEERLWRDVHPDGTDSSPVVFNDQYLTTGGQLYELTCGHDRFIADLRPLAFRRLGLASSLCCHPYDLAALLVAEEAGVIVEDPVSGGPLRAPLDTTTPVNWVAYANPRIAALIRPVLRGLIAEMLTAQ